METLMQGCARSIAFVIALPLCAVSFSLAAQGTSPAPSYSSPSYAQGANPPPQAVAPAPSCTSCGTVESVRQVTRRGEGTGAGAVLGGVAGGVLGHQFGQGRGNTAMTVLGAAGGAYAGHQAEKNIRKKSRWQVRVRLDDGRVRTLTYANPPAFHQGDRVRLVRGRLNYVG